MWYFSWILGVCLACSFAVLNALWLEVHYHDQQESNSETKVGS